MKKLLKLLITFVLIGGIVLLGERLATVGAAGFKIARADVAQFEGTYDLKNSVDENSIFSVLKSGKITGEMENGVMHGYIYKDGIDAGLIEFYRASDGKVTLNLMQLWDYGLAYADNYIGLPISSIVSKIGSPDDLIMTGEQFKTITGYDIESAIQNFSGNFDFKNLAALIFSSKISVQEINGEKTLKVKVASDKLPINVDLNVWRGADHSGDLEIPETNIADSTVEVFQEIFQAVFQEME